MDGESLKSLGWLLLFGVAFYLMMRMHMGGHSHGGDRRSRSGQGGSP